MKSDFGNTIANILQFWNWLKNKRSKDKILREVWKAVETKNGQTRMANKWREKDEGWRKEVRRERKKKFKEKE